DEDRKLGGSPLSIAEAIAAKPNDRATPLMNESTRPSYSQTSTPPNEPVRKQPTFDSILAKRDEPNVSQHDLGHAPALNDYAPPHDAGDHKEESVIHSASEIYRKRMSVSPQLPNVARMSGFGTDFFSPSPQAPPPQDPVKQEQRSISVPAASSIQSDKSSSHATDEDPKGSKDSPRGAEGDGAITQNPALVPTIDTRSVPPLRTPSPNTKAQLSTAPPASGLSPSSVSQITATEPLKPRVPEYSPSDYEPQSAQTQNTLSTFNGSPVKENDKLSEEIMKSLSPIASSSGLSPQPDNSQSLSPGARADPRSSSYTLSDYDNYWADSTEKPAQDSKSDKQEPEKKEIASAPAPAVAPTQEHQPSDQQPPAPISNTSPPPDARGESPAQDQPGLRRKFSWEAEFSPTPNLLKSATPPAGAGSPPKDEPPVLTSPSPLAASDVQSPRDVVSDITSPGRDSPGPADTSMIVVPPSGGISHQVSKASTLPPTQQPITIEPPSPISVKTDESTPHALENRHGSPAEDRALTQTSSNVVSSATPPPERPITAAPLPGEFPQTTPFRDIMNLATPTQRTLKFEAGRNAFATWESGLENWLSNLMNQHPEYATANSSFSGAGLPSSSQGGHVSTPSGSHPPGQQPYYQQYLNASSPTTTAPAAGRSRLGGLPLSTPSGSSAFGNSGNQLGTKSKEFMHSAGKMGKGLFSKGRSKLRGTGDKGEPIPPPVQTKPKTERRTSWGLSRGPKSRAEDSATHSEKDMMLTGPPTQPHHASQSSQSSIMSPYGPTPQTAEPGKRLASQESYGPQPLNEPSAFASKDQDDKTEWQIPTPISNDNSTWDPFKGTELAKDDVSEHSGVLLGSQEDRPQQSYGIDAPPSKPLSGNATPTPANAGIRMVPSEEPATSSQQLPSAYAAVTSQETPPAASPQTHNEAAVPQRHSSFVGLPLIRRGSTFDVTSKSNELKPSEPIDELVSPDVDDDEAAARRQGTFTSEVTVGSTLVGTDSLVPGKDFEKDVDETNEQAPPSVPTEQRSPRQQMSHHHLQQQQQQPQPQTQPQQHQYQRQPQPPQQQQPLQQHPFQMHPVHQGPMPPQQPPFGPQPMMPHHIAGGNPIQKLPPAGPWKLEESHLSEPLHTVTPRPQQLPPSGPWKLEESHLAAPLHIVNRNRSGTGSSQQEPYFGYDKETGVDLPSPSSSAAQQYQQRQKPAETPPSSANRYPGLFPGQQRSRSDSKDGPSGPGPQFLRRPSNEGGISRTSTGGPEVSNEERGRSRKASALLKDIGSRFRKVSSERRGTSVEPKPQQPQQQPQPQQQAHQPEHSNPPVDAASVSSFATEENHDRKKARSSFLLGLRNRPSTDHGRQQSRDENLMPPPTRPENTRLDTSPEGRRMSRFNTGLGVISGQHRPSGPARASTSLANEQSHTGAVTPPLKKRFSGFNTKAAVAGVFHRASGDVTPKPGTPNSSRPVSSQLAPQQPAALDRPSISHPGFERSNTAGPVYGQMQPAPVGTPPVDSHERRKRRGSAAGLISGLLGHGGRNKESQNAQPGPPPGHQPQARRSSGPQLVGSQPGGPPPMGQQAYEQPQGQPQGQPQDRRPSGPQLPTPQLPGARLGSPQLPGSQSSSPQLARSHVHSPQLSGPTVASPQPQRPQQFATQQPPMLRRMTGNSSLMDQPPVSPDRPSSGGGNDRAQIAYQNSRPSPLGFGSTTPAGSPPIGSTNIPSRHGTPQTPFSVGQILSDSGSGRMRSTSPAASAIRTAPRTQASYHNSTRSMDNVVQPGQEGHQVQRPTHSPNMSFRPDPRAGTGRPENVNRDDLPQSPVSQASKTGPPSVSSMATGQSPRLNTSFGAMGRRQSSQLSQSSQPNTPSVSMASRTPPTQNQPFSSRMGMSPPQQQQQQFPPGFQQQQSVNLQQGGYQIAPGQQHPAGYRGPPGGQPTPSPHPQAGMAPGRPSMQMQYSTGAPQVPPKDVGPQAQAMNVPPRHDSPASKWKGLRNRMSGQTAHKPSPSQSKAEGEKLSASKILGAFKRSSKTPAQQPQGPPGPGQTYQGGPPMQQQMQPGQHPQQFAVQPPYGQAPTPRQSSQFGNPPIGQMQAQRQSSQLSGPPVGLMQTPRQSSQFGSPPMGQQQFQRSPGSAPQGQPGMGHPHAGYGFQSPPQPQGYFQSPPQPQGPQGHFQSPAQAQGHFQSPPQSQGRFQSPPQQQGQWQHQMQAPGGQSTPSHYQQGYYPVQVQGMVGQNLNSAMNKSPPQQHHGHAMQHNVQQLHQPIAVHQPMPIHSPVPIHPPSPHQGVVLNKLVDKPQVKTRLEEQSTRGDRSGHTPPAPQAGGVDINQQNRPDMQRLASNDSPHSGRSTGSPMIGADPPAQQTSPGIGASENDAQKTQPPTGLGLTVATSAGAATSAGGQVAPKVNEKLEAKMEESRGLSLSPPSGTNGNVSPANSNTAVSDEPTPDAKDKGKSIDTTDHQSSHPQSNGNAAASKSETTGASFHAELEDTEEARKRRIRLDSQEEKIHYDPNADSDGEVVPQMSATSYPGQEWNPYGMPEYGEWNE
ncbi:hypothetical protein FALBO_12406, partial [Fusarium albosuccineum]